MSDLSTASSAQTKKVNSRTQSLLFIGGILFTFAIAFAGIVVARVPYIEKLGPLVAAILLAIGYRQVVGYPEIIKPGIQFSAKKILRFAIILFGFRLNLEIILNQGLGLLVRGAISIAVAMVITLLVAKWLKADNSLSLLLAVGTGVCGAAAIAAVSPIIKSKDEDTAIGVGIIALMGTVFTIIYTILRPFLPLTDIQYGIWSGISLHEIAHVAAGAAPAGEDALAIALLAKLGRVLLLIPLCFLITYWMKRKNSTDNQVKVDFPWFLIGFIITSLIGSYVPIPQIYLNGVATFSAFLLTAAMVGLGLNVSFKALRTNALKPLVSMIIASVILSIVTYLSIYYI